MKFMEGWRSERKSSAFASVERKPYEQPNLRGLEWSREPWSLACPRTGTPAPRYSEYSCDVCGNGNEGERWHCPDHEAGKHADLSLALVCGTRDVRTSSLRVGFRVHQST